MSIVVEPVPGPNGVNLAIEPGDYRRSARRASYALAASGEGCARRAR